MRCSRLQRRSSGGVGVLQRVLQLRVLPVRRLLLLQCVAVCCGELQRVLQVVLRVML